MQLTYAMTVLRLGVNAVLRTPAGSQCPHTATELYRSTRVFVLVSLATWVVIIVGYLIPFFVVAILLTRNGYSPTTDRNSIDGDRNFSVFPLSTYGRNPAPPDCIERLKVVTFDELRPQDPKECCVSHYFVTFPYELSQIFMLSLFRFACQNSFLSKR